MKLRWVFLIATGLAVLAGATGFGVAVLLPDDDPWLSFTAAMSAISLITVPVLAGLFVANLTFDPDGPDGRRGMRRLLLSVAALELLAIVGCLVVAMVVPHIAMAAVAVIVISVVLLLVGLRLGGRVQRRNARKPEEVPAASLWSRGVIRRKVTRIVLVFVIATGVGVAAFLALGFALGGEGFSLLQAVLVGVPLGFLSASMACIVVSWPLGKSLRAVLGASYTEQKAMSRVVLRGKDDELSLDGERRAAEYARIVSTYLPFQIAQLALLYGGLWLQQFAYLRNSENELAAIPLVIVIVFPILSAVLFPPMVRQARRAKRYATAHPHVTPAEVPSPSLPSDTAGEGTDRTVQPG